MRTLNSKSNGLSTFVACVIACSQNLKGTKQQRPKSQRSLRMWII